MADHGTPTECKMHDGEKFNDYIKRLQKYFLENNIEDEQKQTKVFLSMIGSSARNLLERLVSPKDVENQDFSYLCLVLNRYFEQVKTLVKTHFEKVPKLMNGHSEEVNALMNKHKEKLMATRNQQVSNLMKKHMEKMATLQMNHSQHVSPLFNQHLEQMLHSDKQQHWQKLLSGQSIDDRKSLQ